MSAIIQTNQLTKSYGRSRGIIDVTFDIQEGEVFGFLGPNGAGKTTTMRTLMGLLHANNGSATIGGLDCWTQSTEVKKLVGYLPGEFTFDPGLGGAQIIEYLGHLRGGVDQAYVRSLSRAERQVSTRAVSLHTLFADGWGSFWWLFGIVAFCAALLFVTPGFQKAFNQAVQQTPWL